MTLGLYRYQATVTSEHDGDTFTTAVDLGFGITVTLNCRLYGANAPELSTQAGQDALVALRALLPVGTVVTVESVSWDKYGGRYDGKVTLPSGADLAAVMIAGGYAVPMKG